jgi:hypothetical protein
MTRQRRCRDSSTRPHPRSRASATARGTLIGTYAAALVALALGGCGGSSHGGSGTPGGRSAAASAATTPDRPTISLLQSPATPPAKSHARGPRTSSHATVAHTSSAAAALLRVSTACAIARYRAPASPLPTTSAGVLTAYLQVVAPIGSQTVAALERLRARRRPAVAQLIAAYQQLSASYNAALSRAKRGSAIGPVSKQLQQAEERASVAALSARVPTCAPAASARGARIANPAKRR